MKSRLNHLLRRHRYALSQKGLDSTGALLPAIRLDLLKAWAVLAEIHARTAAGVVHQFFAGQPDIVPHILPRLDQPHLHHLGFEVHEPHDLILPGFYRWMPHFGRWLAAPLRINGTLRFPSSLNFQERVGAYTEMMQIWVEVEGRELLIEMFDIYRPRTNDWVPVKQAANFDHWSAWCRAANRQQPPLPALLAGDNIWHYGIHIATPNGVEALHQRFRQLIEQNAVYRLAYPQPVHNPRDTSLHTKIINEELGLEIEFLTQNI